MRAGDVLVVRRLPRLRRSLKDLLGEVDRLGEKDARTPLARERAAHQYGARPHGFSNLRRHRRVRARADPRSARRPASMLRGDGAAPAAFNTSKVRFRAEMERLANAQRADFNTSKVRFRA